MRNKKVLITGASGYLGSQLFPELLASFPAEYMLCLRRDGLESRLGDLLKKTEVVWLENSDWEKKVSTWKPSHILHLATCYGRKGEDLTQIQAANVQFPLTLLRILLENQEQSPVFINTDTFLSRNTSAYSLGKKQFLDWLIFHKKLVKVVNIKIEHFYGHADGKFLWNMLELLRQEVSHIDLTDGSQKRDFIHIKDLLSAYMSIIKSIDSLSERFTEFEVGSGQSLSIRETLELAKKIIGNNKTELRWGALPLREDELSVINVNVKPLHSLGWQVQLDLESGLREVLSHK